MRCGARLTLFTVAACATGAVADGGVARRLEEEPLSPCPAGKPYSGEPSPFGWPLTPMDWAFGHEECWKNNHLLCDGERQSPMDIDVSAGHVGCDSAAKGENGTFAQRGAYNPAGPLRVQLSKYMGTLMAAGNFGQLNVMEGGKDVMYDAVQVHLASPSLHTINGTAYDAELMVLHKRRGEPDMLDASVIVSMFFTETPAEGGVQPFSRVFQGMGFDKDTGMHHQGRADAPAWESEGPINLHADIQPALEGAAYVYNGSLPVPPCSETVKWIVLGSPQPVSPMQSRHLREMLSDLRGGEKQRRPLPRGARCVAVNTPQVGGNHEQATCEADKRRGTWRKSARCWGTKDRCWSKRYSAVNINTADAIEPGVHHPQQDIADIVHYKKVSDITVSSSDYSLDAHVDDHGDFGHLMLNGHVYFAKNVSVKAVSQHTIDNARYHGELMIEHVMFGDTFGEGLPGYHEDLHKVMVSVPLKLGSENNLLRSLHLEASTSRSIRHRRSYHVHEEVDLAKELQPVLGGRWFWYSSNSTHVDCGTSVRWMVFETPLEVSLEQLNHLALPVSGVDSSQTPRSVPPGSFWRQHFPDYAVEANETACENLPQMDFKYGASFPHWDYGNERCWGMQYAVCGTGMRQSPINIPTEAVSNVGTDNFLSKCSWKPVADLRVTHTGHGVQVASEQLGYVTFVDEQGFPDYYQVAQFHVHMPSEHMIGGKQFAAELHVVHKRQKTVLELESDDLLVTAIMFDLGDEENPALKQLFLSNTTTSLEDEGAYRTMTHPFDLMRSFGPVIDGPFYRYEGGLTTPPCSEVVKWFVFEKPLTMSRGQWLVFKDMFPNPMNNRPVQPLNGRQVSRNSFEEGTPVEFRYFLNRDMGRNKLDTNPALIVFPIIGTLLLCMVTMGATFVREDARRKSQNAGGLESTIGRPAYDRL